MTDEFDNSVDSAVEHYVEESAGDGKDLALASMALAINELIKEKKSLRRECDKLRAMLAGLVDPPPGAMVGLVTKARAYLQSTDGR